MYDPNQPSNLTTLPIVTTYIRPISPAYTPSQAVVTPEVINTTPPATTVATSPTTVATSPTTVATSPITVGGQLGLGKGMYQLFKQGAATTKANFKAQSFGEKFNTVGSTIGSIMNALNTHKQLKLSRQALGHQMAIDNKNYEMARKQWNQALEDKARYREAMAKDQGRSYETVGEIMAKYGA